MELVTISFSHFNERARWALAHHGVPYEERRYMPMFHFFGVRKAVGGEPGRADGVSSPYSTPVLVRDGAPPLRDSAEILRWVDATYADASSSLYPELHAEAILAFESEIDGRFGADTRRVAYHVLLSEREVVAELARRNVGRGQATLFRFARPLATVALRKALQIDEARAARSLDRAEAVFDRVEDQLDGGRYLFGDRFSAADLTFACMAAPLLLPQRGYGAWLPEGDAIRHPWRERILALAERPAGAHALKMFDAHRPEGPWHS